MEHRFPDETFLAFILPRLTSEKVVIASEAKQSDEVVARAKPVAISRVPSLRSGQGFVVPCLPQAGTPRNDKCLNALLLTSSPKLNKNNLAFVKKDEELQ